MNFCKKAVQAILIALISQAQCLFAVAQNASQNSAPSQTQSLQNCLYDVFNKNKDSIVKVYSQRTLVFLDKDGTRRQQPTLDVGSGFIAGVDGTIITSAYITYAAKKIWVEWNGKLMDAESVGYDPLTTISVLKVPAGLKKNAPAVFMDAKGEIPQPATLLMSLSYEMGLPPAPRIGLVTAHNIQFGGSFLPTVYIRTNIPAPNGSMGGAIFDMNGKFVGMIIASLPEIGGSFVLPAKAAARIKDDIVLCGEPIYSWFGLRAEDYCDELANRVVVTMVIENAPAKKAGFKEGDVILEINSQKVSNNTQLRNSTFFVRPGETAKFKIQRGKEILNLEILAEKMDSEILKSAEASLLPIKTIGEKNNAGAKKDSTKNPAQSSDKTQK